MAVSKFPELRFIFVGIITTYKSGSGTQKNFTYFPETDEEKIPEDYYYMIIAHFADGTVAYSSVHKK